MAEQSTFRNVIDFFFQLGVYDVILPFLLVFTIVFAILEKTKVLGMEEIEGKKYTKKNLNAMVAFVVSFFVVASTRLVAVISEAMANIVLLILLAISFLMLIGTFMGEKEVAFERKDPWMIFFMFFMFMGIVLIFLNALDWLQPIMAFLSGNFRTDWVSSLILLVIVILIVLYVTKEKKPKSEKKE